ncbi:MAG: hypothetical protein ACPGQS_03325 [Bradymonadia bacterium]
MRHGFSDRLVPVIMGVAQLAELRSHSILVRHIVHRINSHDFEEAGQILNRAYAVFGLSPLDDLRRFIENHAKDIVEETKSDDWLSFVEKLGRHSTRWSELTRSKSVPELLGVLNELQLIDEDASDSFAPKQSFNEDAASLSVPEPRPYAPIALDSSLELPKQPSVQETRDSVKSPSINFRAAAFTFVITLSLAFIIVKIFM